MDQSNPLHLPSPRQPKHPSKVRSMGQSLRLARPSKARLMPSALTAAEFSALKLVVRSQSVACGVPKRFFCVSIPFIIQILHHTSTHGNSRASKFDVLPAWTYTSENSHEAQDVQNLGWGQKESSLTSYESLLSHGNAHEVRERVFERYQNR